MTRARAWFAARSLRERRLLVVMVALLALTIVWAGIIRPVGDGLAAARERHAEAVIRLGETRARVDAVRELARVRPAPLSGALADAVRARASDAGFALASLDVDAPDRVRIAIQSARPGALFGWIAGLERNGVIVDALDITNNGDRTVSARLTLQARGT